MSKLLTVEEAAARLSVSRATLYRHWRAWGVPGRMLDGKLRFRDTDLDEWIADLPAA